MTDEDALAWVIEQLGAHARLSTSDRGVPGVLIEGPNHELIVVYARVAPHLLISELNHR